MKLDLREEIDGRSVCLYVAGDCPEGSGANDYASVIIEWVDRHNALAEIDEINVNLVSLRYSFGNAIGAVYQKLRDGGKARSLYLRQDDSVAWNGLLSLVDPFWNTSDAPKVLFVNPDAV